MAVTLRPCTTIMCRPRSQTLRRQRQCWEVCPKSPLRLMSIPCTCLSSCFHVTCSYFQNLSVGCRSQTRRYRSRTWRYRSRLGDAVFSRCQQAQRGGGGFMHPPPQDPCILRLLARSLPLASPGSPLWFLKVGIVSLQIGLQIGLCRT